MADNYLEKQRAAYEERKAQWERDKKLGKNLKRRKTTSTIQPKEDK